MLQANVSDLHNTRQPVQELHQLGDNFSEDPIIPGPESSRSPVPHSNTNGSVDRARVKGPTQSSPSQTHRLEPPVDIVVGDRTKIVRRRHNPNEMDGLVPHQSASGHRRHHSELEGKKALNIGSRKADMPDASLFTPSRSKPHNQILTPFVSSNRSPARRRTPSQNALMEKDAIETLLFMSSPENSGYQSGSRARKSSMSVSIEAQMAGSVHTSSQGSNTSGAKQLGTFDFFDQEAVRTTLPASVANNPSIGLEAQAGDEIDRLLDQMEVDRHSDAEFISYNFDFGSNGHPRSYELGDTNR